MKFLAVRLEGNRSRNGGLSPETSKANHCQSAVLELDGTSTGKLLRSLLGREAKRIVQAGDHVLLGKKGGSYRRMEQMHILLCVRERMGNDK